MTGLFANLTRSHRGPGRQAIARRRKTDTAKLDAFAEALSELGTVTAAAASLGFSRQQGGKYLAKIKKRLGWQAQ